MIKAACGHEIYDIEHFISVQDRLKNGEACRAFLVICPECYKSYADNNLIIEEFEWESQKWITPFNKVGFSKQKRIDC